MSSQTEKSVLDEDEDDSLLRRLVLPEEDRMCLVSTPWRGGYRWFRSPNVIPIERWRSKRKKPRFS
jgi:hypothetical protein